MNKLSVVIITFNEEKKIRTCLESVKDIADEIVVVDSFSTDTTKNICLEYGVKFMEQKWSCYSEQKNIANDLVSNDWIFSIDADEVVSDTLKKSILFLKEHNISDNMIFSMNRLTNYCGRWIHHCGWYPDKKIRIWNRNIGRWEGKVHEIITFSKDVKKVYLEGDLLHYSFSSKEEFENQMFHFAELKGVEYHEKNWKFAGFFCIFSPIYNFIQNYVFKLGFLEGKAGLNICLISAKATKHKYITLKKLYNKKL